MGLKLAQNTLTESVTLGVVVHPLVASRMAKVAMPAPAMADAVATLGFASVFDA